MRFATAAEDLFDEGFPIGQPVKINGVSHEVVGILEESGSAFAFSDSDVYIPMTTAHSRLYSDRARSRDRAITQITAQAASEEESDAAIEQIIETIRDQHGIIYAADDDSLIAVIAM